MASSTWKAVRRAWFQIHLWLGLLSTLLLIPIGLTGIVLAWPSQFNSWANPAPHASGQATLPLSAYLAAGRQALDGARIGAVTLPARAGAPVAVATEVRRGPPPAAPQAQSQEGARAGGAGPAAASPAPARTPRRIVYLEPATAKVLEISPQSSAIFDVSRAFHESLMVRGWGRPFVGVLGVVLLILSLSGLWLWWPRGAFKKAFAWKRTPGTMMNLHHVVGFWLSIPLAIVSATGVFLSFPSLLGAPPRPPAVAARPSAGPSMLTIDEVGAKATGFSPTAKLASITLPSGANPWRATVIADGRKVNLQIDDKTGAVSVASPPRPTGDVALTNRLIHEGGYSSIWKWLVTLTGLLPLLLGVTGAYTWVKLEMRKARARSAVDG